MRVLWTAIVLALATFQCNNGQEESATVSEDLIQDIFSNDTTFENKFSGGESTTVSQDFIDVLFNADDQASENGTDTGGTAEDPNQTPKAGVSLIV